MIVLAILNYDYKNLIMLVLFLSQLKGHMLPVFFTQLTEKLIQPRVNDFSFVSDDKQRESPVEIELSFANIS